MLERADQKGVGRGWRAASILHGSDLSLWRLLEKLPAGAYTCDAEGLITYFNQHAVQLWGRAPKLHDPADRFCGSFKLFLPDGSSIAHDQCWMALALKTGNEYNGYEIMLERPDGQRLTVLAHAAPIFDEAGVLLGAVNVLVDITERKQVEEMRQHLAAIIESSDDAIIGKTLEGIITSWNRGAERLYEYTPEEVLGKPVSILIPPDLKDEFPQLLKRLRQGEHIDHYETQRLRKDGTRLDVSLTISPIRDASGRLIGASKIARDITERKQIEADRSALNAVLEQRVAERTAALKEAHDNLRREMAERHRMQEVLLQQEKLAALGTLLANVAHELNNPLAVAAMQIDNLQEEGGSGAWAEDLELLRQAVERCQSVVQSFLALARQQAPTRSAVSLNAIIGDVLVLLEHALEVDDIILHLQLAEDLPKLWADPHQLHHVVTNLLTNAHHALRQTPPPRHLTLTTTTNADQSRVTLEVTDSGPGIPEELQRRIFEPFFTTRSQDMGTGLGLPLCHNIVEGHGGSIHLVSQLGHGTTFYVTLPVDHPSPQAAESAPESDQSERLQRGAILLIDDEPGIVQALTRLLQRDGHDITKAANGLEGLAALGKRAYDVILCDMRMPDLDGPGFYRELERRYPCLLSRVIFLTGDVLSPEAHIFLDQVNNSRLIKPFKAQEVRRVIQQMLETR